MRVTRLSGRLGERGLKDGGTMSNPGTIARGIRVLVVDDHPLTLSGITALVRKQPDMELCGEAATAETALELAMSARPDVIVLDLRLRGGVRNGIELASTLAAMLSESRVLVYSGYLTESGIRELTKAGVTGYVSKTAHPQQLALAIRTVAAGDQYGGSDSGARVTSTQGAVRRTNAAPLTEREISAIQLLADGLENDEIAERLALSPSSVRLCLTSAFAKLGARNRTEAVVRAHRRRLISID